MGREPEYRQAHNRCPASAETPQQVRLRVRNQQGVTGAGITTLDIHIPSALREAKTGQIGEMSQAVLGPVLSYFLKMTVGQSNSALQPVFEWAVG